MKYGVLLNDFPQALIDATDVEYLCGDDYITCNDYSLLATLIGKRNQWDCDEVHAFREVPGPDRPKPLTM